MPKDLKENFYKNLSLPLTHYYNYKGKIIVPKEGEWIIKYLEYLRRKNV
jgi:hypothetical protein